MEHKPLPDTDEVRDALATAMTVAACYQRRIALSDQPKHQGRADQIHDEAALKLMRDVIAACETYAEAHRARMEISVSPALVRDVATIYRDVRSNLIGDNEAYEERMRGVFRGKAVTLTGWSSSDPNAFLCEDSTAPRSERSRPHNGWPPLCDQVAGDALPRRT